MKTAYTTAVAGALALGGLGAALAQSGRPAAPPPRNQPVRTADGRLHVVELFQSQGCSDCPPAEANLNAIAGSPNVLALSYGVTYWDQLGWRDTFATPQFTARQWEYARARGRGNVWTPQVYVDGKADLVGSNRGQLDQTIASSRVDGPAITAAGGHVGIAAGRAAAPATVWLVSYDPRTLDVPIAAGENGGRTLPHRNVVRALVPLGTWSGAAASFVLPAAQGNLARAVLVQAGKGGPIVSAAKV